MDLLRPLDLATSFLEKSLIQKNQIVIHDSQG